MTSYKLVKMVYPVYVYDYDIATRSQCERCEDFIDTDTFAVVLQFTETTAGTRAKIITSSGKCGWVPGICLVEL